MDGGLRGVVGIGDTGREQHQIPVAAVTAEPAVAMPTVEMEWCVRRRGSSVLDQ